MIDEGHNSTFILSPPVRRRRLFCKRQKKARRLCSCARSKGENKNAPYPATSEIGTPLDANLHFVLTSPSQAQ